jgi:hypothetical protein
MVVNRKHKSQKNKSQRGGYTSCTPVKMNQKGGSPASTLVMQNTVNPPIMSDYVVSDRIRESWYDNSLSSLSYPCSQKGGSPASDLVMKNLTKVPETKAYPKEWKVNGNINSLNLYQTTGGSRKKHNSKRNNSKRNNSKRNNSKRNNSKRNSKYYKGNKSSNHSRKNKSKNNRSQNKKNRTQRGGSDWIMSQYSLGNVNALNMSAPVNQFSQSTATARTDLMNPATLGLAGSGYPMTNLEGSNVQRVGAPIV